MSYPRVPIESADNLSNSNKSFVNRDLLTRTVNICKKTLILIKDILLLLRYENSEVNLNFFAVNIVTVINSSLRIIEASAREKGLTITMNCDRAPTEVVTDPARLEMVLIILLNNAVQYSDSGEIIVSCQALSTQQWSIAIKDSGIGIAPEETENIFAPFYQIARSPSDREESTGLGLTIAASLVKLLQGEISVSSQLGVGSQFRLTFDVVSSK